MTSLRELQLAFVDGVLFDHSARICSLIAKKGLAPQRRLAIYRNNAIEGFLKALGATFPVVMRLSGEDWFRQTGREYMRHHPSRSGNLHYVGEHFAAFLDEELRAGDYAYFADVARLEWAYQEVLVAADHSSFDVTALANVAADEYGALSFRLHPALRLVESSYPTLAIWKANQPQHQEPSATISLDAGASRVLIIRREDHVELRELSAGDFALLAAFMSGATLEVASEAALQADAAIDLGAALARLMQLGTFTDFSVASDDPPTANG